jgi:tetratricopeptide (TPR) repeat protein
MGSALKWVGRFEEAEQVFSELMIISSRAFSADSPRYLNDLYAQASLYADWGRHAKAMPALEEIMTTASKTPDVPVNTSGRATYRLAQSLNGLGDYARAEAETRTTLEKSDELRTTTRFSLQRELAVSLSQQGRFDEATALFEEIILGREERSGPESLGLIRVLVEASAHQRRSGSPAQALAVSARAHEIGLRITPRGTWLAAAASGEYGIALLAVGQSDEAMPVLEQAHADLERTFGPADARVRAIEDAIAGAGR